MTLEQCYEKMGGSYEEVLSRLTGDYQQTIESIKEYLEQS